MAHPAPEGTGAIAPSWDDEEYMDRSVGQVARVSAAKGAAEREMTTFGDVAEYEVTTLEGRAKDPPLDPLQSSLAFPRGVLRPSRKEL